MCVKLDCKKFAQFSSLSLCLVKCKQGQKKVIFKSSLELHECLHTYILYINKSLLMSSLSLCKKVLNIKEYGLESEICIWTKYSYNEEPEFDCSDLAWSQ